MKDSYNKIAVKDEARVELHDALKLTGAEVSINVLPKGTSVPFVHSHKQNEEIYGILDGEGYAMIDDRRVPLSVGVWLRISPTAKRRFFASENSGIKFICIQVKENSLEGYTAADAVIG